MSALTALTLPLISGSSLALLGAAVWRARGAAATNRARLQACEKREQFLIDTVQALLDASRRSSEAVLGTLDRALRELDGDVDSVLVFVTVGDELACIYASGARTEHFRRLHLRRDDLSRLPAKAAQAGCRAVLPGDGEALMPTDRSAIAMPMIEERSLRAVVYVSSPAQRATTSNEAIVRTIERAATPYAIAIERESDRADAAHDGLTGLLAPRTFRRHLHEEIARAATMPQRVLCLWFIDTDRFKEINDGFGHRAGDTVLQTMASLLRAHLVPDVDIAARNGGDEFCALLRGASKSLAIERAEAFCAEVRGHDFGLPARITASVGIATYPHDASSSSALLETADAAMYHSKRNGRDRVSFVVEAGSFASLRPEAASELSRSPSRWHSKLGESCAERSSH